MFGWRKDPFDRRDYLHLRKLVVLPPAASLATLLEPAWDQGNEGSCVGQGVSLNLVTVMKQLGIYLERIGPRWIYNGARYLDGTLSMDIGTTPGSALDWLLKQGLLVESKWLYVAGQDTFLAPSSERMAQAVAYLDFAYYRVDNGVDGIKSALAEGHAVSLGAPWFQKWMDPGPEGILAPVAAQDEVAGGHETCLYDYDDAVNSFGDQNSWGGAWGKEGRCRMPYGALQAFKQLGGYDAHYVTMKATIVPLPQPAPSCAVGNRIASVMSLLPRAVHRINPRTARGEFTYSYKRR